MSRLDINNLPSDEGRWRRREKTHRSPHRISKPINPDAHHPSQPTVQRHLAAVSWASLSMTLNKPWNHEAHLYRYVKGSFLPKPLQKKSCQNHTRCTIWFNLGQYTVWFKKFNKCGSTQCLQHVYSTKAFKLPLGVNINQSSSTFKGCSLTALCCSKFFSIWILDHLDHRATRYCSGL